MNLTESIAFDTEEARTAVEARSDELCDISYPMLAYEIIDLLQMELLRLYKMEARYKGYK